MTEVSADLARLIGSRICHDLVSPIGAISNGVELIAMMPEGVPPTEELALIERSARQAAARLRLFRVAFGAAAPEARMAAGELSALLSGATAESRVSVALRAVGEIGRDEAQLCCLGLLCFETALVKGGRIVAARDDAGGWRLASDAEARRTDPELWRLLGDPSAGRAAEITAAQVQFRLLSEHAAASGRAVAWRDDAAGLEMRIGPAT